MQSRLREIADNCLDHGLTRSARDLDSIVKALYAATIPGGTTIRD